MTGGSFLIEGVVHCYFLSISFFSWCVYSGYNLLDQSCCLLGASLLVAIKVVTKGAEAEGMDIWDYIWRGHGPTSVAVMTEVSNITT